jgi:hypothetical protein
MTLMRAFSQRVAKVFGDASMNIGRPSLLHYRERSAEPGPGGARSAQIGLRRNRNGQISGSSRQCVQGRPVWSRSSDDSASMSPPTQDAIGTSRQSNRASAIVLPNAIPADPWCVRSMRKALNFDIRNTRSLFWTQEVVKHKRLGSYRFSE